MLQFQNRRLFIKPVLHELRKSIRRALKRHFHLFTWNGIYSSFEEISIHPAQYDDRIEVEKHLSWTKSALNTVQLGKTPALWHDALGIVAALIGNSKQNVRVLDFGGAVGSGYVQLLGALPKNIKIDYHVVELDNMCSVGRELFNDYYDIKFHSGIPAMDGKIDVIYINGALQYMSDYKAFLSSVCHTGASYILFGRLPAGDVPTYATEQLNLRNVTLPYWILNLGEFTNILGSNGYRLIFEGFSDQEFDQDNFPVTHRLGRFRTLLFAQSS